MMARMMARERRMYFQRNLGSSAYISWREGRMVIMIGDSRGKVKLDLFN